MSKQPINKHYVSTVDKKIREFDAAHQPSAAQQAEIEKYKRIYKMRDESTERKVKKDLWDL